MHFLFFENRMYFSEGSMMINCRTMRVNRGSVCNRSMRNCNWRMRNCIRCVSHGIWSVSNRDWSVSHCDWSVSHCYRCNMLSWFFMYYCVEAVYGVCCVVYSAFSTVRFHQAVAALDDVAIAGLVLVFYVAGN